MEDARPTAPLRPRICRIRNQCARRAEGMQTAALASFTYPVRCVVILVAHHVLFLQLVIEARTSSLNWFAAVPFSSPHPSNGQRESQPAARRRPPTDMRASGRLQPSDAHLPAAAGLLIGDEPPGSPHTRAVSPCLHARYLVRSHIRLHERPPPPLSRVTPILPHRGDASATG